ncbi:MAG: DUF1858 domain-containing protein [Clostridiales bacterium]|nr:DUF1858 domain-containing protein [Clostridiales bacterium]
MERIHIDLNETVYALCTKHPALVEILSELGFTDITRPGMLQSAGRFMTPVKGAAFKHIPLEQIVALLDERGYDATVSQNDKHDKPNQEAIL